MQPAGQVPRWRLVAKGRPSSFRLRLKSLARGKVSKELREVLSDAGGRVRMTYARSWQDGMVERTGSVHGGGSLSSERE